MHFVEYEKSVSRLEALHEVGGSFWWLKCNVDGSLEEETIESLVKGAQGARNSWNRGISKSNVSLEVTG
jgi:hypothetical protein